MLSRSHYTRTYDSLGGKAEHGSLGDETRIVASMPLRHGLHAPDPHRQQGEPPIARLPTLFSLDRPVPRYLTGFILYVLAPVVLAVMTWKAAACLAWGVPLALLTGMVTVNLAFLDLRRCPPSQRRENSQNAESQQATLGFANLQEAKLRGASRVG